MRLSFRIKYLLQNVPKRAAITAFPVFAQDVAGEEPDLWLWDGFVTVVGEPIYVESKENRIPEDAVLVYAHTDGTQVSVPATKSEATGNCFFPLL